MAPRNGTQLGSGMGVDLTCPFGVSSACGAQASWSIFGADAAEVPGTRGHSCQEAAMPHIPEDEEPPGEPQAAQSPAGQVSAPSLPAASLARAKSRVLSWGHIAWPGQGVCLQPVQAAVGTWGRYVAATLRNKYP